MSDDPYGGRKPGCISLPLLLLLWALAIAACVLAAAT